MNIRTKIAALLFGATLAVGCAKSLDTDEQSSKLDWSQTSAITLDRVAMAPSAKATDALMKVGQTFRLYALDPATKTIIATRTYSIATTDGVPVIDATQDKIITLPFGAVDIFLVGPVKATIGGVEYEIADATKVNPMRGVDLVSSKTSVIVKNKETPITPTPLKHRMVKLELAVSMEKDGFPNIADLSSYKNAYMWGVKHGVSVDNVATTGTFAFDDGGGSVKGTLIDTCLYKYAKGNSGEQNLKLTDVGVVNVTSDTTGTAYSAYDYVFPTAATQPKLTVTYGYTLRKMIDDGTGMGGVIPAPPTEAHEMSGRTAAKLDWAAGTYVKLHTTLTPSIVMTVRTQILPWGDGGSTPVEPPANNDLIFWYSGEDGPEIIDGKWCWRDRSGNGNHAELTGSMTYDRNYKYYCSKTPTDHFIVPALGLVTDYTLELTVQSVLQAQNAAAVFEGPSAAIRIELPYWDYVFFSSEGQTIYAYEKSDLYIYEHLQSYAFCRNATTMAVLINGIEKQVKAISQTYTDYKNNKLWLNTSAGGVGKQRLYGAKMYKKYMNNDAGRSILAANHAAKLSQLGVTAPLSGTTFDYVKDGLLVDLRGETAPTGTNPNRVWPDQSGRGNSPVLDAGVVYLADAARGTKFYGGNASGDNLRFKKSLGTYKALTIEVVTDFSAPSGDVSTPLIQFTPNDDDNYLRSGIYWCHPNSGYIFEAPYLKDARRVSIAVGNLKYSQKGLTQLSCFRLGDKLFVSQNGYTYSDYVAYVPSDKLNSLVNGIISTNYQHIYAVRIYDRALSTMERQHNYVVDKAKYKILP